MTKKQREMLARYSADVSKGAFVATLVGMGTQKLALGYVIVYLLMTVLALGAAYLLEGSSDDAE